MHEGGGYAYVLRYEYLSFVSLLLVSLFALQCSSFA